VAEDVSTPVVVSVDKFINIGSRMQILVVDDNNVNQKVAKKMLSFFGFNVCDVASDGLQALDKMKTKRYDLVLMDCMMPNMVGIL
jgi:CheY-like chemotaxis protein